MRIRNDLIPNISGYDADLPGSIAPYAWVGVSAINGAVAPWSIAPLGSIYFDINRRQWFAKRANDRATADWSAISQIPQNVFTVGANGNFPTLTAALAAITDASASNQYTLVIAGAVDETSTIVWKNHVHAFWLPGATVRVTMTAAGHAATLTSLTNVILAAADPTREHIVRAGAVSGSSHALQLSSCTSGVELVNLYVLNQTTGVGSCHGIVNSSSSATMMNCTGIGGGGGAGGYGIYNLSSSSAMTNCTGIGGGGGASCYGIVNSSSSPAMTNCTGIGGGGGAGSYGIYNLSSSSPTMTNCTGIGGTSGTTNHGLLNSSSSSPMMTNCTGIGGGGSGSHGIVNSSSSSPTMTNCTGIGGIGGSGSYGISVASSAAPAMFHCAGIGGGAQRYTASVTISASSRQEDTITPPFSRPYRLVGVSIDVTAAAAGGVTLTLRTASGGGGNVIAGPIAVDSTGNKTAPVTGFYVIASGTPIYARLSATSSTLAYTITYTYTVENTTCYGLYQDSDAAVRAINCTFVSNGSSNAVYVTNNGIIRSSFLGGLAASGLNSTSRSTAFACQSSWNPGQVYNMVLDGGSTNLTAAAGTANGSNVEV